MLNEKPYYGYKLTEETVSCSHVLFVLEFAWTKSNHEHLRQYEC
jgi:hypothetical protein